MKPLLLMLLLIAPIFSSLAAFAAPLYEDFYTVKESQSISNHADNTLDPLKLMEEVIAELPEGSELKGVLYSLMNFEHHQEAYGDVTEPYNRKKHFGTWVRDPRDGKCYNTRAKVLIRDSKQNVDFNSRGCTVKSGLWSDPYTGRDFRDAGDIQIDHFVPLKNAYISGAFKWDSQRRCLYANFLGNNFHLLPVSGKENNKKSDSTPEGYMPPNSAYQCQYLVQWLKVKFIWALGLTPPEKENIESLVVNNHCRIQDLTMSSQELEQQRRFIADNMSLCQ